MNIYTTKFTALCPVNGKPITYCLEIKHINKILVEDILKEVNKFTSALHEDIADELFSKLSGRQRLIANHHGVVIETKRKI